MYKNFLKRIFDILLSLITLLIIWPLLLLIAIGIKLTSKGSIFFMQERLGKDGKMFNLYKFRTMVDKKRTVDHEILKDDTEITSIGSVLRRFKIDELPQLLNVLNGSMSIVGPRPSMPSMLDKLDKVGKVRLQVSPGLTGLAQVNGNIFLDWEDRWKYDKYYVENLSFMLDMKIIIQTILIIIKGEDKFIKKPKS